MKKSHIIPLTVLLVVALVIMAAPQVVAQWYILNITTSDGGTTVPASGAHLYSPGAVVRVLANPNPGWSFVKWTLTMAADSTVNPIHVTMDLPVCALHAEFEHNYDATIRAYCRTDMAELAVDLEMDGAPTGLTTPQTYIDIEGEHTFTVPDFDEHGHPFAHWNTEETSPTITISSAGIYTAYYGTPSRAPSLTGWGMLVLLLMLVTAGVVVIRKRRQTVTP